MEAAGDRTYPREQVCVLRARASLLAAAERPQAAATMALAAALSARRARSGAPRGGVAPAPRAAPDPGPAATAGVDGLDRAASNLMPEPDGRSTDAVEVVLLLRRSGQGRPVVDVRTTAPPIGYGTVELAELPLLLEAVLVDLGGTADG